MKKWLHSKEVNSSSSSTNSKKPSKKLKRTIESGHSYEYPITFDTFEEYQKWWEEDKKYED